MPESIMMDAVAGILKVTGRSMERAASGPIPGSTPTIVPTKQPIKQ
jgi:hypothetical protein